MSSETRIPEFGLFDPNADYILRPGGYAVIFSQEGVAVASAPGGLLLPGGAQDDGESAEAAAIREAQEECGLVIALRHNLGIADELVFADDEKRHYRKRCAFFLAEVIGEAAATEADHRLMWLSAERAKEQLRHESQRWAVEQACRLRNA